MSYVDPQEVGAIHPIEGAKFLAWLIPGGGGRECQEAKDAGHEVKALKIAFDAGYERGQKHPE